jgi:Transglutaminase-like superfamily
VSLDFYRTPVALSDAGTQARLFDDLPRDIASLVKVVQGLLVHEHMTEAYGVTLPAGRRGESHVRSIEEMLAAIAAHDPRPITAAREAKDRYVCVCRSFALLLVAILRHQGVPARARCGFGAYFEKGKFLDHWVAEYWNAAQKRWVMVDSQIDDRQRKMFGVAFDTLDVKRDQFLVAGDAWTLCRSGEEDPQHFGILDMFGLWFVASNIVRDVAALNNREMLPWDVWGAMQPSDEGLDLAFLDRLAALTHDPDRHFDELRALYRDPRIAVPATVFNAVLNRPEAA